MPDQRDATRQPVGMVDNELAGSKPRKTGALGGDYPQGKQRKETGVARKALFFVASAKASPAAVPAGTPRGVGISGKKKGSEIIRALQYWWCRGDRGRTCNAVTVVNGGRQSNYSVDGSVEFTKEIRGQRKLPLLHQSGVIWCIC